MPHAWQYRGNFKPGLVDHKKSTHEHAYFFYGAYENTCQDDFESLSSSSRVCLIVCWARGQVLQASPSSVPEQFPGQPEQPSPFLRTNRLMMYTAAMMMIA
jgi:hypothetical protein